MEAPLRVGMIGLGSIGEAVLSLCEGRNDIQIVAALVRRPRLHASETRTKVVTTLEELLTQAPDVVVEAGGHSALRAHGPNVLRAGYDMVAVSVGALADEGFYAALKLAGEAGGAKLKVASGAIGGLDVLAAAAVEGLARVIHTTRKPATSLLRLDDALRLEKPIEIFRGSAREGALKFPESINVAAAVSLAGVGFDRTEVRVIADPDVRRNQHELIAEGNFGTMRLQVEAVPSDSNPRTARLAALSVFHALLQRRSTLLVG